MKYDEFSVNPLSSEHHCGVTFTLLTTTVSVLVERNDQWDKFKNTKCDS